MSNDFRSRRGRLDAALAAVTACCLAGPAFAEDGDAGPRYTYLGAGYEWTDVKYAVRADGASHEGFKIEGSLGITDWLHVYGEYFGGELDDYALGATEIRQVQFTDIDSTAFHVGLGLAYALTPGWDAVLRIAYVDSELDGTERTLDIEQDPPVELMRGPLTIDDDGYQFQGLVRGMISERTEVNFGYAYTEFDSADISNADVTVGLLYGVSDAIQLKARGIVFDDDTGLELGIRVNLGGPLF